MTGDPVVHDNADSLEKAGMRNAWGNVAGAYDEEAVRTGILGSALAGLYTNRLDDEQQRDVHHLLTEHLSGLAESSGDDVLLPAEVRIVVAEKSPSDS